MLSSLRQDPIREESLPERKKEERGEEKEEVYVHGGKMGSEPAIRKL